LSTGKGFVVKGEERLMPLVRAKLAERLVREGFRPTDVAKALSVTPAAVTQYLKGSRGGAIEWTDIDSIVVPLAEKLSRRMRSGLGGLQSVELLEAANQLLVLHSGRKILQGPPRKAEHGEALAILKNRLSLELAASEKYLELANEVEDDYVKLVLRMIASDSMRHADVVSQVISWYEAGHDPSYSLPSDSLLRDMLSLEDSAQETELSKTVEAEHPVAKLLLEWIDIDEGKHEKIVERLVKLSKAGRRQGRGPG